MPLYDYECQRCGRREVAFRHIDGRHDAPECCGRRMTLIISPSHVQDDIEPYISPTTGRVIGSRSARRDDLRRSGARPWEGLEQEIKEAQRKRRYAEERYERKLDEAVRSVYYQLPPSKRRILEEP